MTARAICVECERVFDLLDSADAEEWNWGHDCEALTWAELEEANAPAEGPWKGTMR